MTRTIPGTIEVDGREFFYLEVAEGIDFHHMINDVLSSSNNIPMPQDGGVIEEKTRITLQDGTSLLALSYKGDLAGWRQKLIRYCELKKYKWGIASNNKITLSDQTEIILSECNVFFEE